jgi:predicted phage terminase large subunit-like protein
MREWLLDIRNSVAVDDIDQREEVRSGLTKWAAHVLKPSGQVPALHHRRLLEELESVAHGRVDRLMVLMPPGSAKSTYSSIIFPAWWFGLHPSSAVIAASHTADLAEHFSRQVRDLIVDHAQELNNGLRAGNRSAGRWRLASGGHYLATGVRGPITGRRADLIIIDDPVKSQKEADSALARELTWDWYRSDLITRLRPGGRVVLIMTRWHEDDLGGRLLAQNSDEWRVLRLPALAEAADMLGRKVGMALWPEWEDVDALERKRLSIGERAWSALFQQSPRPMEGGLFKVEHLATFDIVPEFGKANQVRAWDLAATPKADDNEPDWTVGLKMHRDDRGRFIVSDVVRLRGTPWEVEQILLNTARSDGPDVQVALPQDPGSAGKVAAQAYISLLAGYSVTVSPETCSKVSRATPVAAQLEGGNLAIVRGHWNFAFIEELRDFPTGRKDDQVDALSRAFGRLTMGGRPARKLNMNFIAR